MNDNLYKNPWSQKNDSMENLGLNNLSFRDMQSYKSESPESLRRNNNYFPSFNLINNNFNHSNSIIYNNNFNLNKINDNGIHNIYSNTQNIINTNTNNILLNNINNIKIINDENIQLKNSFNNNNHHNLNLSYNFSPYINNSFEGMNILSKKRGDSFNSCPSLKGNHLSSFKSTDDSCNNNNNNNNTNLNANYINNINNFSKQKPLNTNINSFQYQNYLSMQNLFLNLNPYTASLMRNNNHYNSDKHLNIHDKINNNNINNLKPRSLFHRNNNSIPKRLHSNYSSHNINITSETNNLINMNINNINNNSFDNKIYNDNLSNSNVGSSHSIKKKRTSLFQNESNKERDLRDFKRFCDGLKLPMCEYICSQIGSRIMQKYLKKFPSHIRTLLIKKISSYIDKLMCNTYGNYFCQKLYNISDLPQRLTILNCFKQSFLTISKNNSGAHAIQFIIGSVQTPEEKKIILDYISANELELAYDQEGTHVLQKIITCFKEEEIKGLRDILCQKNNLSSLCQDAKGICVLKKLIGITKDENIKNKILEEINQNCVEIALSPYGNYIIQMIFEEWDINICYKLVESCLNNCVILSSQKYSSNIIVKIIELYCNGKNKENKYNIEKRLKNIFFDENNIIDLYNNKYGRLLLTKVAKLVNPEEKESIKKNYENSKNQEKTKILEIFNELFI